MKKKTRAAQAALLAACASAAAALAFERSDVGAPQNETYARECGSCHVAFPPGLLPERSWRRITATLASHFGDNAEAKAADVDEITRFLAANAADHGSNLRSRAIAESIPPGQSPLRISETAYIGGIHGGLLDPAFKGVPRVKSLSECAACHPRAAQGSFAVRRYVITDEAFRAQ